MKYATLTATVLALGMLAGASGCSKNENGMGPAQQAGKAVDTAGAQVAREMQDKIDKANAAARQVGESAEQTRARIAAATADAASDASEGLDVATEKVGKKVEQAGERIQESAHK